MMCQDKASTARERILAILESGCFAEGDKLPGAREIAEETGISLLTAQAAIKTLERDGVLELRPRSGAFVKANWRDVPLESRLFHFNTKLPWMPRFEMLLRERFPSIKLSRAFTRGIFEIRTTLDLLSNGSDYMDVSSLFREAFPDSSDFYESPFRSFRQNGKLLGVPVIFSPRVIVYNPEIFKARGCQEPKANWTWDEFIGAIRALKAAGQPGDAIFSFTRSTGDWMSFVLLAGGSLIDPSSSDPVKIDSHETRHGLRLYSQIQKELGNALGWECDSYDAEVFARQGMAMTLMPREFRSWLKIRSCETWNAVPLPSVEGRNICNTQATDLLCVRRECKNHDLAVDLIKFLLSKEMQDFIGEEKYGIPIRKSSAEKSLDKGNLRDKVFFDQIANMSADYHLDSPDISNMIYEGIGGIWKDGLDIDAVTSEIASALRVYLKIRSKGKGML